MDKIIKDKDGKDIVVNNPQEKILKIIYKGPAVEKYYFRELANEIKLRGDKKSKKDLEPKIKVKDGDKVSKGTELYSILDQSVKAKLSGTVKVFDKYIELSSSVNKTQEFTIPRGLMLWVKDGDEVKPGDRLTEEVLILRNCFIYGVD